MAVAGPREVHAAALVAPSVSDRGHTLLQWLLRAVIEVRATAVVSSPVTATVVAADETPEHPFKQSHNALLVPNGIRVHLQARMVQGHEQALTIHECWSIRPFDAYHLSDHARVRWRVTSF